MRINIITALFAFVIIATSCDEENGTHSTEYILSDSPRSPQRSAKRGVSYGFQLPEEDMALLGPSISWFYNWGPDCSEAIKNNAYKHDVLYLPMAWNGSFDEARIKASIEAFPECKYLLAFNEPNLTDQCNLTPRQAADEWPRLMDLANRLNLKVVSPAMNYGTLDNYNDPVVWLDEFFEYVSIDDIDAIALHCYMGSASALKSFIDRFDKYGKPIWLTEFCAWEPHISSVKTQMNYMSDAINYLEACDKVERYAWFIPRTNGALDSYPYMQLLTKSSPFGLSDLGKVFTGISTIDTCVYYLAGQIIEAENFAKCNASEGVDSDKQFAASVSYCPTTDTNGNLDLTNFGIGKWTEYYIELHKKNASYVLNLRINAIVDSEIEVMITDKSTLATSTFVVNIPTSNGSWTTTSDILPDLTPGKYSIRLKCQKGLFDLNYIKVAYNTPL